MTDEGEKRTPTFVSLRYPGAKRYFGGLTASMVGTWMQSIGLSWLVLHRLHGNGRELGLLGLFQFTPMLLLGAWAGSLADRFDKRRFMLVTQFALGVSALVLAWLDFTKRATMPSVYLLSAITGFAGAFDTPVRRALVGDLVPPEIIPNAMALNTSVMTSSRVLGMAAGGFVTRYAGTGWCFAINGASYLIMIVALRGLGAGVNATPPPTARGGVIDALRHVVRTPVLRVTMGAAVLVSTFTYNFQVTFPLLTEVFHRQADGLGVLYALSGAGSFVGAIITARRATPSIRLFLHACTLMGVGACAMAWAPNFLVCELASLLLVGVGGGLVLSQLSGLLTSNSPGSMRGRVLALQTVVFLGSTPIGGPIVGVVSDHLGPRSGMAFGGFAALISGVGGLVWWRAVQLSAASRAGGSPSAQHS